MTYAKLKEVSSEAFRRYSGVKPKTFEAMVAVLEQAEGRKKKAGRPSKLSLEEQLLLTLTYWREYRTQFHVALSYGIHETTATRIIGKVEEVLVASGRFKLPKKQALGADDHQWVVVLIDSTETPIERPNELGRRLPSQKSSDTTIAVRKSATP
jgi:DNA-binding FadR family transcriptional regulator